MKLLTAGILALISVNAISEPFVSNGGTTYELNGNIVSTSTGLQWLQWSATNNLSVSDVSNPESTFYQDGWRVATNIQVTNLFQDFYPEQIIVLGPSIPIVWPWLDSDGYYAAVLGPVESFRNLFGDNVATCYADADCPEIDPTIIWHNREDRRSWSQVYYGDDTDNDGFLRVAYVGVDNIQFGDFDITHEPSIPKFALREDAYLITNKHPFIGVALVRPTPVPLPPALWLLSVGLLTLVVRSLSYKLARN